MIYKPRHFLPQELISGSLYTYLQSKGKPGYIWYLIDSRLLISLDTIRDRHGIVVMNTWFWGGEHNYRGFRDSSCTTGAQYGQHRYGRAGDFIPIRSTAEDVRQDIIDNPEIYFYITAIETDIPWVHIDVRNHTGKKKLLKFPRR